ncbi:MAG: uracil-DNA glycosylase [SAR324 cluster bacterium]|nr:uracil-DNA glycosylase [SAR324 cluster bacterium]MBF0352734.1 uracil-DNA glycosylase [SAR324 cluster bacterium]
MPQVEDIHDLVELERLYCKCQQCPLGGTRINFVFGSGHVSPVILFLGEAPGADEDTQGLPFVGKAGQLLTKMIQVMGIDRPDVYIANVVKCRPPGNRVPASDEIAQCFPIIRRQIELLNPKVIVTLGNVPTHALIPDAPGITLARGSVLRYQNWNVIPTFHPSYLLRTPSAMELVWDDLKKVIELAFGTS